MNLDIVKTEEQRKILESSEWSGPKRDAKIELIKELGAKDVPIEIEWQVEFTDFGYCPICMKEFNFNDYYSDEYRDKEQRCKYCNQLFSIGTYIT